MAREEQPPSYPGDHIFQIDGRGSFQIHHGADPKECMDVMSVVLPAENSFIVPPHYHPLSTEWMKLLEGRVEGVIGGVKTVMNAGDDWLEIPAGTTHSFHKPGGKDGVKVVWLERCAPDASMKKRFFEDFIGSGEESGFLRAMACFYRDGDSFPALPGGPYTNPLAWLLVNVVGGLVHASGMYQRGTWDAAKAKHV